MAERSIALWHEWNEKFGVRLYHEVGMLMLRRTAMQPGDFEYESLRLLEKRGLKVARMDTPQLWKRFPAWNPELYRDGVLEIEAGYAESGRAVAMLIERAKSLGVQLREHIKFFRLDEHDGRVKGVAFEEQPRNDVIPSEVEESRGDSVQVISPDPSTSLGMTTSRE